MTQFVELIENVFRSLAGLAVGIERIADFLKRQQGIDSADRAPAKLLGASVPGSFILHPNQADWGLGQVHSVDGMRLTVNFENVGKQLINASTFRLL